MALALGAAIAVVLVVVLRPGSSASTAEPTPSAVRSSASASTSSAAASAGPGGTTWAPTTPNPDLSSPPPAGVAEPVSVAIPSIGVTSQLIQLGTDQSTGVLVPPVAYDVAGWFTGGPRPGDTGPSIIAGHVDSHLGPGVFFKLRDVAVGDQVLVARADGSTATFDVYDVEKYPKAAFPTQQVYGPTPDKELRVITCGGDFDYGLRSYVDNIVVYARLAA